MASGMGIAKSIYTKKKTRALLKPIYNSQVHNKLQIISREMDFSELVFCIPY